MMTTNVRVVYVRKRNAKLCKTKLIEANRLDERYQMILVDNNTSTETATNFDGCITIPIIDDTDYRLLAGFAEGFGYEVCPYSSKMLGSRRQVITTASGSTVDDLTLVQLTILGITTSTPQQKPLPDYLVNKIQQLDLDICPKQLEVLGDDRTIILPLNAFEGETFVSLLYKIHHFHNKEADIHVNGTNMQRIL
jgi:hypothetical protein